MAADLQQCAEGVAAQGLGQGGEGAIQLDVDAYDPNTNDTAAHWCMASSTAGGSETGSPGELNGDCVAAVDWCRLWYPAFKATPTGEPFTAYAHVFDHGLTDGVNAPPGMMEPIRAEFGYGPNESDPALNPEDWTWFDGDVEESPPSFVAEDQDRYGANIVITETGVHDFAARFSKDGGSSWLYCDLDGSDDGYTPSVAGHAIVLP